MLVPEACRRQDQVTATHRQLLALDRRPRVLALDDHPDRIRRVTMRRRPLAGQQQLHAKINRRRRLHVVETVPRICKHEHATLRLLDRRQLTGADQQWLDLRVFPMRRTRSRARLVRRQHRAQVGPQRNEILLPHGLDVIGRQIVEPSERQVTVIVHQTLRFRREDCVLVRQLSLSGGLPVRQEMRLAR